MQGLRDIPTAPGIDLAHLALRSEGYSGAEMAALCREAAMSALTNAVSKAEAEAIEAGPAGLAAAACLRGYRGRLQLHGLQIYEWPPRT